MKNKQPIETAPTDGTHILVFVEEIVFDEDTRKNKIIKRWYIAYGFLGGWVPFPYQGSTIPEHNIVHWQHLPS